MNRAEAIRRLKANMGAFVFKETNEALDLATEALKEKHQLSGETSTISENESVEDDLFNKSFWRMGMHDTAVIHRTMADTSTNEDDAESATTTEDCISRQATISALQKIDGCTDLGTDDLFLSMGMAVKRVLSLPPVTPKEQTDCTDLINWLLEEVLDEENWELNAVANGEIICRKLKKLGLLEVKDGYYVRASVTPPERTGWIPVSERLPKDLEEVVVTWVNRNPPVYYRHEKDKPQTGIAVLYRDTWHWWDSTIVDVLAEYGSRCEIEHISEDIEIIAWQPLPEPYKGGDDNDR